MDIAIKFAVLPNGHTHFYQHWIPKDPPARVVYVHGLGDHIGRYSHLVSALASSGLAVALYDQRGHGRSDGRRGHVNRFSDWVEDLAGFVQFTSSSVPPDTPLFIIGQSLGALVAINFVLSHAVAISGLVCISASLRPTVYIPEWKRRAAARVSKIAPWFTVDNGVRNAELTRDVAEVEALASDDLFHRRVSLSAGLEIQRNVGLIGGMPSRLYEPLFMLAGTGDRICDPQASSWFAARASSSDKDCRIYDGMYHDLLHDIGWQRVLEDVKGWILTRAGVRIGPGDQYRLNAQEGEWQDVSRMRR